METLGKPNQTLLGHTNDCLTVCDELLIRREHLFFKISVSDTTGIGRKSVVTFASRCGSMTSANLPIKWQSYIRKPEEERWKHQTTHALPIICNQCDEFSVSDAFEKSPQNLRRYLRFWHITCKCCTTIRFPKNRYRAKL